MRHTYLTLITLLLIPHLALAQATQPAQVRPPPAPPISAGCSRRRTATQHGYERYRDLRDGAYTSLSLGRETGSYRYDVTASHIGYRDQRYTVEYVRPRFTFGFNWTSLHSTTAI
jgi:hypothetical protein